MGLNPPISVTLISAEGIKNLNWFRKMDVYAEAWIKGLEENKKSTSVAKYKICMKSGKTKGLLQLSCDFESEQPETEAEAEANEPLQEYPKTCNHLTFKDSDTSDKDLQTNLTVYKPEIKPQSNKSLPEYQTRLTINKPYESESEYRRTYNHRMFGNRNTSKGDSLLSAANILSNMRG